LEISLAVPEELRPEYLGAAGQHVVLRASLEGEEARRTYSLINSPQEWPLRIVARLQVGGRMSRHLAQDIRVGDEIDVLPPNGSLTPTILTPGILTGAGSVRTGTVSTGRTARIDEAGGDHTLANSRGKRTFANRIYVAFACGCGVTPIVAIVRTVLSSDPRSHFILFYGNTSTARAMCLEELQGLKNRYVDRLALHFVMSREPQEVELYNGRIDGARVKAFARMLFRPQQVTEYFVCGPGDMIDQVSGALREMKVAAGRIHSERFTSADERSRAGDGVSVGAFRAGASRGGTPATVNGAMWADHAAQKGCAASAHDASPYDASSKSGTARTHGAPFVSVEASSGSAIPVDTYRPEAPADSTEVTVLMDGRRRTFAMRTDDETLLDAAERAGLELPFSCRAGVCSTCRTKIVRGEVEMAQNYALEEWELEQGYVLACQSRAKTRVVELDYDEK
jgi:ring-1,2-phenylacetyl-CoA epoxidase subunit PaaE